MGQRWFILSAFLVLSFIDFSDSLFVDSLNSGKENEIDSSVWNEESGHLESKQLAPEYSWENFDKPNKTDEQPESGDSKGDTKWLNILSFDKLYNLTEKDWGLKNETKLIFINAEDHLKIYEKEEKDNIDSQLQRTESEDDGIFHLLSPEGFLCQIHSEDRANALERTKRQAENGKRRCRCRRKGRRNTVRRRRRRRRGRRNRVGQQRPARRRRRRGRRRCVCRKKGEEEGKSEGEEPEVEEADGEEEKEPTTEGEDETATEEAEGEADEEDEEEDEGDDEGGDEDEDDSSEDDEESDDDESSAEEGGHKAKAPKREMPSAATYPAYVVPYPNMVETPVAVIPASGYPMGTAPTGAIPMYRVPSHSALGALVLRKRISNAED